MANEKPKEAPAEGERVAVSDEELRVAFSGAAISSNKIYVTLTGAGARITFMEQLGEVVTPVFRTAVVLSYPDALALRDVLTRTLKDVEVALKSATSGAEEKNGD